MVHRRENFLPKIAKQINAGIRTRPWASVLNTRVWAPLPSSGPGCHLYYPAQALQWECLV